MSHLDRRTAFAMGIASLALYAPRGAATQTVETRRIVVNFPPGAALDGVARLVADHAQREGRAATVVENRPGAAGNIGAAAVARARPDGQTLLATLDTTLTVNPHLYRSLGFDPDELVPVALLSSFAQALLVRPDSGFTDLAGFVASAQRGDRPVFYATGGNGSPGHLAMEFLRQRAELPASALTHVPERGNAEAVAAVLSGTVQAASPNISGAAELVRAGRLRAIAVTGAQRLTGFPDVPTFAESGYPGFDVRTGVLLMAPRGTPEAAVAEWSRLARAGLAEPTAQARLEALGLQAEDGDPAATASWIRDRRTRWGEVVRMAGMRAE